MAAPATGAFLIPRDITKTGKLPGDIWVIGCIVRVRTFKNEESDQPTHSSTKGKGKKQKTGKAKTTGSREGIEIYINGGNTPSDVLMIHAWDEKARQKLQGHATEGTHVMLSGLYIKEVTEKAKQWSTSRHNLCGVVDTGSEVRQYEGSIKWLAYHPVTPLPSLQYVPHNTFVCVAGLVLSPGPVTSPHSIDGTECNVTNFFIRTHSEIVKVEAWRDTSAYAHQVASGQVHFFDSIKKIHPDKGEQQVSVLRYQKSTRHHDAPPTLEKEIKDSTEDNHAGCTMISPIVSNASRGAEVRQYQLERAPWMTLSVVADIMKGGCLRSLKGVIQIPSVFIKPAQENITYMACSECHRGVRVEEDGRTTRFCQCVQNETCARFRTQLRLMDETHVMKGTIFDAMNTVVAIYADGDETKMHGSHYHGNTDNVQDLSMAVEAIPFTILAALEENTYTTGLELSIKAIEPSFHIQPERIRHPLKAVLRSEDKLHAFGKTFGCPPCALADTKFEEGAGVVVVPGGTTQMFRALLIVTDKQGTTEPTETTARTEEASPAVRCRRKVTCALQETAEPVTHILQSVGSLSFATKLLQPRKGEILHAIVTWRSQAELTLIAFATAADKEADAQLFKQFFAKEVEIANMQETLSPVNIVRFGEEDTPCKKHKEAITAAEGLVTPEQWSKRMRAE